MSGAGGITVVIGGGLLGLTAALRLAQSAAGGPTTRRRVVVVEGAATLGGLAAPWSLGGITWDRHYHVTLQSDLALRALLADLDLERFMRWGVTRTGFFAEGRLHSLSTTLEFVTFPVLGFLDKARLALTILRGATLADRGSLQHETALAWLTRWSGRRAVEKLWLPLLRSKLGDDATRVSASFIGATIARMYAARRAGMKREMFGYVQGGYARILETMGARLTELGVEVRCGEPVAAVEHGAPGAARLRVRLASGEVLEADDVLVATPAPVAAALCPLLDDLHRSALAAIEYQGIVCASMLLRRPLGGFYVTNLADSSLPFTGIIEMTALVDPAELGGHHLVYLPRYAGGGDPVWETSDDEVRRTFVAGLARVFPGFTEDDVVDLRVSRVPRVYALPTVGYAERMPPLRSSVEGLWIATSAHIVEGTLNVNETVDLAERAVHLMLGTPTPEPVQRMAERRRRVEAAARRRDD